MGSVPAAYLAAIAASGRCCVDVVVGFVILDSVVVVVLTGFSTL